MVFVSDTHALLWARSNQTRRLGRGARRAFELADLGRALIYVSAGTLIELDWLEMGRKLEFRESLESLVRDLSEATGYELVSLTPEIIVRSRKFRGLEYIDRLIVATAEELDCPLITADLAIQESRAVPIVRD